MATDITNLDRMIDQLYNECKYLSEAEVKFLCEKVPPSPHIDPS